MSALAVEQDAYGEGSFFALPPSAVFAGILGKFGLYIKTSEGRFRLYAKDGGEVPKEVLDRLSQNGVKQVYVRTEHQIAYDQYMEDNMASILADKNIPAEHRVSIFRDFSGKKVEKIFQLETKGGAQEKEIINNLKRLVADAMAMMSEARIVDAFGQLLGEQYDVYNHSVNVACLVMTMANFFSDIELLVFMHQDIQEVLAKPEFQSPELRNLLQNSNTPVTTTLNKLYQSLLPRVQGRYSPGQAPKPLPELPQIKQSKLIQQILQDLRVWIGVAGFLHDIGKSRISKAILNKKGKLTDDERTTVQDHAILGFPILYFMPRFVQDAAYLHHEDYCGGGYPVCLDGDQIPFLARVLRVCDVFDALTSKRVYKDAMTAKVALAIMTGLEFTPSGVQPATNLPEGETPMAEKFDEQIMVAFLHMLATSNVYKLSE